MKTNFTRNVMPSVFPLHGPGLLRSYFIALLLTCCFLKGMTQVAMVRQVQIGTPLYAVNGKLLFAGDSLNSNIFQLWVSDGTTPGTHFLKTFSSVPGQTGNMVKSDIVGAVQYNPIVFNNNLYFFALTYFLKPNGVLYGGYDLWKSDGTAAGTMDIGQLATEWEGGGISTGYPSFCVMNNALYFSCGNNSHGVNLWKTDGGTPTKVVNLVSTNFAGWGPVNLTAFNNEIYFSANDDVSGPEVWKSDGTAAGTHILKDIFPGPDGVENRYSTYSGFNVEFTVSGNYLYFRGWRNNHYNFYNTYRTDGTEAGTIRLDTTIYTHNPNTFIRPYQADVNGTFFYTGFPNASTLNTSALIRSDGTAAGTAEVITNNLIKTHGIFTSFKNKLYFDGEEGINSSVKQGLFVSDGTTAGTSLFYQFPFLSSNVETQDFLNTGNTLYFRELMKVKVNEMSWRMVQTDGTPGGTTIHYGATPLGAPVFYNGSIYFWGIDTAAGTYETAGLYAMTPAPDNATLPVTLTGFTATFTTAGQVALTWKTESESNNKGFYIERSSDGQHFSDLHFVAGIGNSTQENKYDWLDEHPMQGVSFYRLRQMDIDGKSTLSTIRSVENMTQQNMVISPNPVNGNTLTIRQNNLTGNIQLQIVDLMGKTVLTKLYSGNTGTIQCNIYSLKAGIYVVKMTGENRKVYTGQFLKE